MLGGARENDYFTCHTSHSGQYSSYRHSSFAIRQRRRNGRIFRCQRQSIGIRRGGRQHFHEQAHDRGRHHIHADIIDPGISFFSAGDVIGNEGSVKRRQAETGSPAATTDAGQACSRTCCAGPTRAESATNSSGSGGSEINSSPHFPVDILQAKC